MEMGEMESLEVFKADDIPIGQLPTLPYTLVVLSLINCNLSDAGFPREFNSITSLQRLDLSQNPICSLPDCIRGLTGLDQLAFGQCTRLKSPVGLPRVKTLIVIRCNSLEKVAFQSISCIPGRFISGFTSKLVEIEYWYNLEPIGRVDAEMRNLLGLRNLESMEAIRLYTPDWLSLAAGTMRPIQGLHEYGIFSTFLPRSHVPGQFSNKSKGSSISFIVPVIPNLKIRGLNIFSVYENFILTNQFCTIMSPIIAKVTNKSKGLKWIYAPACYGVPDGDNGVIWLSHWKLGDHQLEGGDEVTVSVFTQHSFQVTECGVKLVHEQEDKVGAQHNSADPSYPFDIGGSLPEFIPGTYLMWGGPVNVDGRDYVFSWTKEDWFKGIFGDSNEETGIEKEERNLQGDESLVGNNSAKLL